MPLGEIIVGAIVEMTGYIIFELIIKGIGKLIRETYYWIRKLLTGKEREIPELQRIEKQYLFKKFKLKSGLNQRIPKGTQGTVREVIDERNLFVEFEDATGQPIIINNEKIFKIARHRVILERKRRV